MIWPPRQDLARLRLGLEKRRTGRRRGRKPAGILTGIRIVSCFRFAAVQVAPGWKDPRSIEIQSASFEKEITKKFVSHKII